MKEAAKAADTSGRSQGSPAEGGRAPPWTAQAPHGPEPRAGGTDQRGPNRMQNLPTQRPAPAAILRSVGLLRVTVRERKRFQQKSRDAAGVATAAS